MIIVWLVSIGCVGVGFIVVVNHDDVIHVVIAIMVVDYLVAVAVD